MANSKGPSSFRNMMYNGKHSLLPPKSPFPGISPSYTDYISSPAIEEKGIPKPREGNSHHLRTSSESILIEDQPSWLDELLNEPETPVRRALYQQQQPAPQQQLPTSSHRRTNSRELDSQFASLSLKQKESSSGRDAVSGPLHI